MISDVLSQFCSELSVVSHYPSISNESPSLHVDVLEIPSHRFELTYKSVNVPRPDHRKFWRAVDAMKAGRPFTWTPPLANGVMGIQGVGGNAQAIEAVAGSLVISVRNAPPNVTWLKAGDMINFANHTKVYEVEEDVTTDNAGLAAMTLNAPLKVALPDNTTVIGTGATFTLIRKPGSKPQQFQLKGARRDVSYAEMEFIELL
ncbi:hypothetical protein [Vibrio natriegens]|uniref:hypothetical protein n=1 Tax=Vibrio natriegens TaxID=691 RepID=UPI00035774B5|nr:hypothetical protein [Vibrio natriegens]ALR15273.1 hypothetical protein PN96_04500 [Vibrio natriegens NBRC 15636 = ATCC 14048 = DSM 759]EPM40487.1 hypothetical protein M272_12675 [Vibrio natriegens NBRC 15636 = ATCC 14048 = DSM 759]MDX6027272.1 hypothetical protein [Vibrio natriegens NBRC 15636 = ATCC 14048 = DSM 759]UUI10598.1 hypothetical protein NP431_08895 [Vibrio natriegens]